MRAPFLAKIRLNWCKTCNVPHLGRICTCGTRTIKVTVAPPGDARPAFPQDLDLLFRVTSSAFGDKAAKALKDSMHQKVVLLNRTSFLDRMDEVVCDGDILGTLRFNVVAKTFQFIPRPIGALRLLNGEDCKKVVVVDEGAVKPILRGASLLVPGIQSFDISIQKDDPVIVTNGSRTLIAVGSARLDFSSLVNISKGMAVKIRHKKSVNMLKRSPPGGQTWQHVLAANMNIIQPAEEEATEFIRRVLTNHAEKPALVAYSGGKDSLATLLLVQTVMRENTMAFFVDTGLEFPETQENVQQIEEKLEIRFLRREAHAEQFWDQFSGGFGPPSRDSRWCCKSHKLSPVNELIEEEFAKGVLTWEGNRKYESMARAQKKRVSRNPWTPKQLSAAPVHNWTALHVYLYIMKHQKMDLLNPLYFQGLARVGCWLCPATSLGDFQLIRQIHPELYGQLEEHLETWRAQYDLPEAYLTLGLWRWKDFPKQVHHLLNELGIEFSSTKTSDGPLSFKTTEALSPCALGGYSIHVRSSRPLNLKNITRFFRTLGPDVSYNQQVGILSVNSQDGKGRIAIFADGTIVIRTDVQKKAITLLKALKKAVIRGEGCQECRTCLHHCPETAIQITNNGSLQITDDCTSCGQCAEFCPLIRYDLLLENNN
ncbi:MAG: phosphoadenosine phosphosulfate reductase family protein [Candidatus Heimdallarchaeota archaeon]